MLILVVGGAGSGKSAWAEDLAMRFELPRRYLATMRPYGEEGERRVARHRLLRADKGFCTIERYTDLMGLNIAQGGTVLLECVGNLLANEMFDPQGMGAGAVEAALNGILHIATQCKTLIAVTNEIGADGACYAPETESYRRALGDLNCRLAACSDVTVEIVAGQAVLLKGAL